MVVINEICRVYNDYLLAMGSCKCPQIMSAMFRTSVSEWQLNVSKGQCEFHSFSLFLARLTTLFFFFSNSTYSWLNHYKYTMSIKQEVATCDDKLPFTNACTFFTFHLFISLISSFSLTFSLSTMPINRRHSNKTRKPPCLPSSSPRIVQKALALIPPQD